jgi:hypothetical protein
MNSAGLQTGCRRIPLGDNSPGEGDPYGYGHIAGRVKIQHRRLQANRAAQPRLEVRVAEVLHESGQVGRPREGRPFNRVTILAGNRGERPPLVASGQEKRAARLR